MDRRNRIAGLGLIIGLVLIGGCATGSGPDAVSKAAAKGFPVDALTALAEAVEREVQAGNRDADFGDAGGIRLTEDVLHAIRTRALRAELISAFLDTGYGLEQRDGLISIIRSGDYRRVSDRRAKNRDAVVIMGENSNRWTLYEGIVKANNFPGGSLASVRAVFTKARIALLKEGQKHENVN